MRQRLRALSSSLCCSRFRASVRPRAQGTFLGVFLIMYGCFRFAIEFVREPDVQLGYLWGGWLTMGQVLSTPLIAVGIGVLLYALIAKKSQQGLPELKQSE